MNKKRKQGIYLMICGVLLGFFTLFLSNKKENVLHSVSDGSPIVFEVGTYKFKLQKLLTETEREKGLSGRLGLAKDEGLLFVFEEKGKHGFWMKDMNFPISIIWLDDGCKVTGFKNKAIPESYPEVFYPELESQYVVEINPLDMDIALGTELRCGFLPK